MTRTLLAIDPGLRNPAAALFCDGVLVAASRVKIPTACHKLEMGQRCLEVAKLIYNQFAANRKIDEVVTEWPRTYRRMKGDPADLFPLAGVGMAVAAMTGAARVSAPTAADWIGNIPKSTTGDPLASIRATRIWSRLSDAEKACVVLSHDSVDACGIGLWKLGRLARVVSFIGAT